MQVSPRSDRPNPDLTNNMRWRLATLEKRDPDYELIVGVVVMPLCALVLGLVSRIPLAWLPACRFHRATGWPCPSCGVSRALAALMRGDLASTWRLQPLLVIMAGLALGYIAYAVVVVAARLPRLRVTAFTPTDRRWLAISLIALILANWAYLVLAGV